ncbi:MAG TPA: hypothetical protein P5543_05455 [Planctomycetota bacterium]|nr:hypothetical protein [Planctomycetota bacterium]
MNKFKFIILFFLCCCVIFPQNEEKRIYIPYDKLDSLEISKDTTIYLPYATYEKMCQALNQQRNLEDQNNVVVTQATYQVEWKESLIHWKAFLEIHVLKEGNHIVFLPFSNITIEQALFNNKSALLLFQNNVYQLHVNVQEPGKHILELSFVTPLEKEQTNIQTTVLQIPPTPIAKLTLQYQAPENIDTELFQKTKFVIQPSLKTTTKQEERNIEIETLLGNTDSLKIQCITEQKYATPIRNILHVENISHLEFAENYLKLQAQLYYDAIQGQTEELQLQIPHDFRILSIQSNKGPDIKEWTIHDQNLVVHLAEPLKNSDPNSADLLLHIQMEQMKNSIPDTYTLPVLQFQDIEREKGYYIIQVHDLYDLQMTKNTNILQIDIQDLPNTISKENIQYAYKYLSPDFTLTGEVTKKQAEYEVLSNIYMYIDETQEKIDSYFTYNIKKSRIFETDIFIPQGFTIMDAKAFDMNADTLYDSNTNQTYYEEQIKEYQEKFINDQRCLHIIFKKGIRTNRLVIFLVLQKKHEPIQNSMTLDLPNLQVYNAQREQGNIGIGVKQSLTIHSIENTQKNIFPLDIKDLYKKGERPNYSVLNLGFDYYGHPIASQFQINKREPYVTAQVYNTMEMEETTVKIVHTINYTIQYTGINQFIFSLPNSIAKKITTNNISDNKNRIKEIQQTKDDANTTYTVFTQSEMLEPYTLQVKYETKLENLDKPQIYTMYPLVTKNTKQEIGFYTWKKANDMNIYFTDVQNAETIDVNDAIYQAQDKTNILALFKYTVPNSKISAYIQKVTFEPVLNTVIQRLHITTTVNKDYTSKNEAVILIHNNRKQMLDFKIPANSRLTSVSKVKELPNPNSTYRPDFEALNYLEPMNWSTVDKKETFKVNIASNTQQNKPFILVIKYETNLKKGNMDIYGDFIIPSVDFLDVPVTYFTWELGLPSEYQYIKFDTTHTKNFHSDSRQWRNLAALLNISSCTAYINVNSHDTGVIPIYPVQGQKFCFYKLNGNGMIHIYYIHCTIMNTLHVIVALITFFLIYVLPKTKKIRRLTMILFLLFLSLILSTLNLGNYQTLYITMFVTIIITTAILAPLHVIIKIGQKLFYNKE